MTDCTPDQYAQDYCDLDESPARYEKAPRDLRDTAPNRFCFQKHNLLDRAVLQGILLGAILFISL